MQMYIIIITFIGYIKLMERELHLEQGLPGGDLLYHNTSILICLQYYMIYYITLCTI